MDNIVLFYPDAPYGTQFGTTIRRYNHTTAHLEVALLDKNMPWIILESAIKLTDLDAQTIVDSVYDIAETLKERHTKNERTNLRIYGGEQVSLKLLPTHQ